MATSRTSRTSRTTPCAPRAPRAPRAARIPTLDQPLTDAERAQLDAERREDERQWAQESPPPAFAQRGPFCMCHRINPEDRARGSLCAPCALKDDTLRAQAEARGERSQDARVKEFDTLLAEDRARNPRRVWLIDLIDYRYASQYHFPMVGACLACHGVVRLYLDRPITIDGQRVRELSLRDYPDLVMQVACMSHAHGTARRGNGGYIDGNRYLFPRPCVCDHAHAWEALPGGVMFQHGARCATCGVEQWVDSSG